MPAVPARPTLVINKIREPIRQIQNEIRDSDIGVELTPADDFGDLGVTPDDTEITLREGLLRRIIRDTAAQDAWNWAGDRADIAGRGYFAILTRYLPGKTNDQEIYFDRIYNQASVKGDPSRTEPDGSDAAWWFYGTWVPLDRFKVKYPTQADGKDNPICDCSDADFMGLTEQYPGWYKADGEDQAVRVENYFYTKEVARTLVTATTNLAAYKDGDAATVGAAELFWADELTDDTLPDGFEEVERRTVVEAQIKYCKIAGGVVVLEETDWAGPDMPVIETIGEELHPYDDQRRIEGMVRNARGAQQGENYLISKFVETVGLAPIPRDRVDPEAIDGYENWWNLANTRTLPYLPLRTYDDQGRELRAPVSNHADPNILPMAQGIAMFDTFIKSTTAVPDPTLGNVDSTLKSGRAIRETVANAKGSTSNFLSNRIKSIQRAAVVVNNLLFPIYGSKPGRIVRIMTGEGQSETMRIGDPVAAQQQAAEQAKAIKVGKLTKDAKFNTAVKITKNFDTRRQQENSALGDLISAEPQLMTWFGDLYLGSGDMPNRKQMAERAKVMLAPPIQQMLAQQDQEPVPPAAQAQIAQLTDQVKHAEAAIQELSKVAEGKMLDYRGKLETEQMKQQAEIERLKIEAARDLQLQQMKDATAIRTAEIAAEAKGVQNTDKLLHESDALNRTQAHEAALEHTSQQHERDMADVSMAHAAAIGDGQADREDARTDASRAHDVDMAEMGQAHALEQGQQAADLSPDPAEAGE